MAVAPSPSLTDVSSGGGYQGPKAPLANGNAVRYSTLGSQVKLAPGQVLHFKPGKGYYAGPPVRVAPKPTAPTPPVDPFAASTPGQIDARATSLAQSQLTPQEQAIQTEQAKADAAAQAQRAEIEAFQLGAANILKDASANVGAGYNAAAEQAGNLGSAAGGQVAADLAGEQAKDQAFAASQGQSGGHTINPGNEGMVLTDLNGTLPGTEIAAEGAAAQAHAAEATALPIDAGNEEIAKAMADARAQDDQYAQQLLGIASQFPGLKAQALQQLNQYELDKAKYRDQVKQEGITNRQNQQQLDTQAAAERANAAAAGVSASYKTAEMQYKWASLQLQSQKAVDAVKAAQAKGERPNAALSKIYGHVVDSNGRTIPGPDGQPIPVKNATGATTPAQKALVNKGKAMQTAQTQAASSAGHVAGKAVATPKTASDIAQAQGKQVGQYLADPSQKYNVPGGVFPPIVVNGHVIVPATTNNPARAQRQGGMPIAQARQAVWNAIGGDALMSRFKLSRAQVMQIVNQALAPYYGK